MFLDKKNNNLMQNLTVNFEASDIKKITNLDIYTDKTFQGSKQKTGKKCLAFFLDNIIKNNKVLIEKDSVSKQNKKTFSFFLKRRAKSFSFFFTQRLFTKVSNWSSIYQNDNFSLNNTVTKDLISFSAKSKKSRLFFNVFKNKLTSKDDELLTN